jgi:hypothetical protein
MALAPAVLRGGTFAFCERCEAETAFKRYEMKQQRQNWTCTACGLHVHLTAGTIFHKSSTGLRLVVLRHASDDKLVAGFPPSSSSESSA